MINKIMNKFFILVICFIFFQSDLIIAQNLSAKDTAVIQFINSRKFFIYKVEKGETIYGISQKFKIPQEEIIHFNKEIEGGELKVKMKLWIPAYSWLKKDTVIVIEPVLENPEKLTYSIAVVTSLNLPKIYTAQDTSGSYIDEPIKREVKDNLEFVEGILSAAEVLKASKFKVHLLIIDSESDSARLVSKLKKNKDIDLIITNETGRLLKAISLFSQSKSIKLFSCGINTSEVIRDNSNAFALLPSSAAQCFLMGEFSRKYFHSFSPIILKTYISKENERTDLFKSGWKKVKEENFRIIDYSKGEKVDSIFNVQLKDSAVVFFISSSNEDFVSSVLNSLAAYLKNRNLVVIGLPTWQYFETIDQNLIDNCNVHLFSSGFIDYNSSEVTGFRKKFREKYYTEPSEISYQGYDALLAAGKSFLLNGKKLISDEESITVNGLYSDYTFVQENSNGAYENRSIHVFQPTKDAGIDLIKKVKP